jgi:hypothetical protein
MKDTKHQKTTPTTRWPQDQQQGQPQTGGSPGQAGTSPGRAGTSPGLSGRTPGQSGQTPGKSGQTPGKSGQTPGKGGGEATDSQWRPKDKQPRMPHQTGEAQKPNAG